MRTILHYVSIAGMFMFLYGTFYLILKAVLGWIPIIKNTKIGNVPLEFLLFSFIIILFMGFYVEIRSPWK